MSVNPVVMIQMLYQYHNYKAGPRTFKWTKNNRVHTHKETDMEVASRKSVLSDSVVRSTEISIRKILADKLSGRAGKVFTMRKIAVPINMSSSFSGFESLPSGSRIAIPKGKKVRAFTYWEKVNDIDLSCFGLTSDGHKEEFSWRTMYNKNSDAIVYSGDETSGFNGGSEYFDVDIPKFRRMHPDYDYIVFCDNVYSNLTFSKCMCKAGFMLRDEEDSGEVYEPKTVQTSWSIDGDNTFSYLFAIDLKTNEMVWLNMANAWTTHVAGAAYMDSVLQVLNVVEAFNVYDLFAMAGELVSKPEDADLIVADLPFTAESNIIRSCDFEKINAYLKA